MTTYEELLRLIPSQFRDKPRLNAILEAVAAQYDELDRAVRDTEALTQIDTAVGKNLDYIGSIVGITRADAAARFHGTVIMDDTTYRGVLKARSVIKNGKTTYGDIIDALNLMWPGISKHYSEDASVPATYTIELDDVDIDATDPAETAPFLPSPTAVKAKLRSNYLHNSGMAVAEHFTGETYTGEVFWFFDGTEEFDDTRYFAPEVEEVVL